MRITRSVAVGLVGSEVGVAENDDTIGEDVVLTDSVGSASKTIGVVVCSNWISGRLRSVSDMYA